MHSSRRHGGGRCWAWRRPSSGPILVGLAGQPDGSPIATFPGTFVLATVIVAAFVGRIVVGLLAAFVGFVVLAVAFIGPSHELTLTADSVGAMLGFAAVAVLVSLLLAARDLARDEAEQSARRYRALVEQLPDVTYISRFADDRLIYVSPQIRELLGFAAAEALREPSFWERHVDVADRERFRGEWDEWRAGPMTEPFRSEYCMIDASAGRVWVADTAVYVHGAGGSASYFQGSVRNESRRHELEEQLRQSQKLEAVGTLAGGIAHDFNNLLGVVSGYARLLVRGGARDEQRVWATEIAEASDRGAALVRQLLAFSRRQVLTLRPLDLNETLRAVDRLLHRLIGEDVELELDLDPELPAISADRAQIEQVVVNLALNARDAMPAGGTLRIETAAAELAQPPESELPAGRYAILTVSDTGKGIDAGTQPRIFEPFFTTKPEGKGTGLGLATVYGIVAQCGGTITVDSEPGSGATFRVYFPATEALAEPAAPVPEIAVAGGTETILLVEDDPRLRELSRLLLTQAGYTVLRPRTERLRSRSQRRGGRSTCSSRTS